MVLFLLAFLVLEVVFGYDVSIISHHPPLTNADSYSLSRPVYLTNPVIGHYNPVCFFSRDPDHAISPFNPGIYGSIQTGGDSFQPPATQIAYFTNGSAFPAKNPVSGSFNCLNGDYTVSAGYAIASYTRIEEILDDGSPNGILMGNVTLNSLPWNTSQIIKAAEDDTSNQTTVVFTGGIGGWNNNNYNNKNFFLQQNLTLRFVASVANKTVELASGNILTAQSIKTTIEIVNYPYKDLKHSLRLQICVGMSQSQALSGATRDEEETFIRHSMGEGPTATFFDLAKEAICDHKPCDKLDISENTSASTNDFLNWKMASFQIAPMLSKGRPVDLRCYKVKFPPGIQNISYDPVIGVGEGPDKLIADDRSSSNDIFYHINKLSTGAFVAVVVGSSSVLLLLGAISFYLIRRCVTKKGKGGDEDAPLVTGDQSSPAKDYQSLPEGTPEKEETETSNKPGLPEMVETPAKEIEKEKA